MTWSIAVATADDADALAAIHVEVWRHAYSGLMPADYLAALDPVARSARWRSRLAAPPRGVRTWLARDDEGVCGMATSGPGRDADAPTPLELHAINLLPRVQGTGLADPLFARAVGDRDAYLWVIEGNEHAVRFYLRHGFLDDGGRKPHPPTGTTERRMVRRSVDQPARPARNTASMSGSAKE